MNNEQVSGKFEQIKGEIKKTWGRLTDDEILQYKGKQDLFFGALKEKYGIAKEAAEQRLQGFVKDVAANSTSSIPPKTAKSA